MNILQAKKDISIKMNPKVNCITRFSRGIPDPFDLSRIINPRAPNVKRNDDASPSIMY